jgi:hypothetical protein
MTTKSRQSIYGASILAAAERAKEARNEADRLACDAWCHSACNIDPLSRGIGVQN